MIGLFLDDERVPEVVTWVEYPPGIKWEIVRDFWEFKKWLLDNGLPDCVSFDFYLNDTRDGKDCAELLLHFCRMKELKLPICYFHSQSESGRELLQLILEN